MNITSYPISELGILKPLMQKYVEQDEALLPFIQNFPSKENFKKQIALKQEQKVNREVLVEDLLDQNAGIPLSELTKKNIESLRSENCFTVTTGHQPCLFTGPVYFVIKILQTIKLADELAKEHSDKTFVPIYWMGAEDHDFEEVNHFHLYGKVPTWNSDQDGAVGRFNTEGLDKVLLELNDVLGNSAYDKELKELFESAYIQHKNYGDATRYLVNELFGKRGLVILEGDRPALKALFRVTMAKELKQNMTYHSVNKSIGELSEFGKAQVKPRECNLFYLDRLGRNRVIKDVNGYSIDNRKGIRGLDEVLIELDNEPGKFSPNVLLRPVYQETILPNLAYLGGPGESAYWLELKSLFNEVNIPMPLVVLRNSCLFINSRSAEKLEKLGLEIDELFKEEKEWSATLLKKNGDGLLDTSIERNAMLAELNLIKDKAKEIDPSLEQVIAGEATRLEKSMENLEKRIHKAQKRKNDVQLDQVRKIIERVFPGGGLQERKENFATWYSIMGSELFDKIYEGVDVWEAKVNCVNV